jgi:phospholipid/cholesterol/gamma-HCH transport system substrate-binding protein
MEPEGRYTIIGVLLLVLAACTVWAGIWLSGYVSGAVRYYTIYFEHQSLRGLQVGGEVNARGLKIGRVEAYSFSPDDVNRVKVDIRVDSGTPVAVNTTANVGRNLVTGVARIDLITPSPAGENLSAAPAGEKWPVIREGTSEFDQISDAFNRIAVTGEAALANLRDLLTEENRAALSEAVVSIRQLTDGLAIRLGAIDTATSALAGTAESLQDATRRITVAVERTSARLEESLVPLSGQAGAALADIRRLVADSRKTLSGISAAVNALERQAARAADEVADGADIGLLELRATARDLRVGIDGLNRTLERYQDPRATLLGPAESQLGPGEKLP